jgi:NAD(P)-dependent dehydrogenase (short-subunit alcohol dehydrogenase family)
MGLTLLLLEKRLRIPKLTMWPALGYTTTLLDTDLNTARKMFNVNVFGPLELIQACAPMLIAAKGQIVNIGSIAGILQIPYQGMYNASKATMHVMTENLRLEMAPFGVRVVLVSRNGLRSRSYPIPFFSSAAIEIEKKKKWLIRTLHCGYRFSQAVSEQTFSTTSRAIFSPGTHCTNRPRKRSWPISGGDVRGVLMAVSDILSVED